MIFKKKKKGNEKTQQQERPFDFEKFMLQLSEAEAKKLEGMSEVEIRKYAAETRVHLIHVYGLLTIAATAITQMQQSQLTIIDTVNKIIDKKDVGAIDELTILGVDKTMAEIKKMADKNVC